MEVRSKSKNAKKTLNNTQPLEQEKPQAGRPKAKVFLILNLIYLFIFFIK